MLHTLNILVDIEMSYVTSIDDIDYRGERTQSLTINDFSLVSFKHFVNEEDEQYFNHNISHSARKKDQPEVQFIFNNLILTFLLLLS